VIHMPDMNDVRRFVAREIEQAILAERQRIVTSLRARLGTVGGGALAVLREVIGAVEGSDDHR
jgi:hypothetical protein